MDSTKARGLIMRIIVAMLVVGITALLTPGIRITGGLLGTLFFAALAIAIINYILISVFKLGAGPNGAAGFILTAVILYLVGQVVSGFNVTVIGALIGALVYGIASALIK